MRGRGTSTATAALAPSARPQAAKFIPRTHLNHLKIGVGMIAVRVEGHDPKEFSDLDTVWAYLNDFFSKPVSSLLFSIEGEAVEMGDLTWKAVCSTPARFSMYLGWDEETDRGF